MWTNTTLVVASGNQGKLKEFSKLFDDFAVEVIPQAELGIDSPEETGLSFIENALLKAAMRRLDTAPLSQMTQG